MAHDIQLMVIIANTYLSYTTLVFLTKLHFCHFYSDRNRKLLSFPIYRERGINLYLSSSKLNKIDTEVLFLYIFLFWCAFLSFLDVWSFDTKLLNACLIFILCYHFIGSCRNQQSRSTWSDSSPDKTYLFYYLK